MKEFYGNVSIMGGVAFNVTADSINDAKEKIFNDIVGIELLLEDGSKVSIDEINWGLIDNLRGGNVLESNISSFEICEE